MFAVAEMVQASRDIAEMKHYRPTSLGQAKRQIETVFADNDWDGRDRRVYMQMHGVTPKTVNDLSLEEARLVLAAMERSRMIIFEN